MRNERRFFAYMAVPVGETLKYQLIAFYCNQERMHYCESNRAKPITMAEWKKDSEAIKIDLK